jgi:CO/xanthine dehydrogenase Mo-binding subunit
VVSIDRDTGIIHVWVSNKVPYNTKNSLADGIGVPADKIVIHVSTIGGDFGGKGALMDLPLCYFLAQRLNRPVRMVMSYTEELTAANPRHAAQIVVKTGLKKDGRITARQIKVYWNGGAYGAMKPNAALSTWHYVGGGYRIPNADFEFLQVYTNTTPGGYFRAPGAHQYTFALECHTDILARELGIDPAEFRRRNVALVGDEDAVGRKLKAINAREVLEAALQSVERSPAGGGPGYGRGVAIFGRQIGGGAAGAVLTAESDGSFTVLSPTVDVGTGTHTIEQQMVADEMSVALHRVSVRPGDTDSTPFDEGPRASRVTYTEGQALLKACNQIKAMLADGAGLPLTVTVEHDAAQSDDVMYFSAQVAEVNVDTETGAVKVLRVTTAHDVGTVINPLGHQGQIDGGFITGLGLAMTEELVVEDGRVTNTHLGDYKLPNILDAPELRTILVPSAGGLGPYDAKAIGELANNATAAAIANAVSDACGARLYELPVTAERVYAALRRRG